MSEYYYEGTLKISTEKAGDSADGIRKMLSGIAENTDSHLDGEEIGYYMPDPEWKADSVTVYYDYNGNNCYGFKFGDVFIPELIKAAEKSGYLVNADLVVNGDSEGILEIRDNVVNDQSFEDVAHQHWSAEKKYEQHFRDLIQDYFSDQTELGQMTKSGRMDEAKNVLASVFGWKQEKIDEVYEEEYWKKYDPGKSSGKEADTIEKAEFVSVWDGGYEIVTDCEVHTKKVQLFGITALKIESIGPVSDDEEVEKLVHLDTEYVRFPDGRCIPAKSLDDIKAGGEESRIKFREYPYICVYGC